MSNKQLVVNEYTVKATYKTADQIGKNLLTNLFGEQVDFSSDITDRIKTFDDVCAEAGVDVNSFTHPDKNVNAYMKLLVIASVLNEGWQADFNNPNQIKFVSWINYIPETGSFYILCDSTYTTAYVGARLCFKTNELATYAVTQFQDIYNDFLSL